MFAIFAILSFSHMLAGLFNIVRNGTIAASDIISATLLAIIKVKTSHTWSSFVYLVFPDC